MALLDAFTRRLPPARIGVPLALLALAAVVASVYYPGLSGPYLLDDWKNIRLAHVPDLSWASLEDLMARGGGAPARRPLSFLSFAANLHFLGGKSLWFKGINLAIHLGLGLLLYVLALQLLRLFAPGLPDRRRYLIGGATAALWLLHPLQVSTVLYAVQRMAQLSALFTTLALIAYLGLREAIERRRHGRAVASVLGLLLAAAAALGSKQNAVLVPVFIAAIELAALATARSAARAWRLQVLVAVVAALPIVVGVAGAAAMHEELLANYARRGFSLEERIATELRIVWHYVGEILLPRPGAMGLYRDEVALSDFTSASTWFALGGWLLALAAGIGLRRAFPLLLFAVLWFLASHSLESTFLPLELVFEHRNYLALFGLALLAAHSALQWPAPPVRAAGAVAVACVLLILGFQTSARVTTWTDYLTLTRTAVEHHPRSARARSAYAQGLENLGRIDDALEQLSIGAGLKPSDAGFPLAVLRTACRHGRHRPEYYRDALEAVSSRALTPHALNALNSIYHAIREGACEDVTAADLLALLDAAVVDAAARSSPRYHSMLHHLRGLVLALLVHRPEQGLQAFERALEIYPRWERTRIYRIVVLANLGRVTQARAAMRAFEESEQVPSRWARQRLEQMRTRLDRLEAAEPLGPRRSLTDGGGTGDGD